MPKKKGKPQAAAKNGRSSAAFAATKRYSTLVQTLVPKDVGLRLEELSREEGMSLAAYVRRLILIDWRKKTSAAKRAA